MLSEVASDISFPAFRLLKSGAQEHPRKEGPFIWVDLVSGLPSSGGRVGLIPLSGTVAPSMCIIDFKTQTLTFALLSKP